MVAETNRLIRLLPVVVVLFYIFFLPSPSFLSAPYIVFFLAMSYIMFDFIKFGVMRINRNLIRMFIPFVPFILYVYIVDTIYFLIENNEIFIDNIVITTKMFIYIIVACIFVSLLLRRLRINMGDVKKIFILIATIQFVCVLMSFCIPEIRAFFMGFIANDDNESLIIRMINDLDYRGYGFANNLFDVFGFLVSIFITIVFAIGKNAKNNFLLLLSIAMLIMPALNARTGVLLTVLGYTLVSIYYTSIKISMKMLLFYVAAIIALFVIIFSIPDATWTWIGQATNEIVMLLMEGELNGTFSEILKNDWILPNDIVFGAGARPQVIINNYGIDSGYVQCLWRYGLVGTLLFLGGVIYVYYKKYMLFSDRLVKCLFMVIPVLFFVYLFKLYPFNSYNINGILFLFPCIMSSAISGKDIY